MINLTDIKKRYDMGTNSIMALDGVSMSVADGEFCAIVGPSGSGKSTLMNIIGCLDTPTDGEYELDGVPVHELCDDTLAEIRGKRIGFVFQQFNLLGHLTAVENVEVPLGYTNYARSQRRERAMELLSMVGLSDRALHRPYEMSGGQQQRVSIARALSNDPAIILADEPTGALDSKTGEEVLSILKQLNRAGKTIIMITHDMHVAGHAGRVITIMDGVVKKAGY